jgi:hypothetical protein
MVLVFSENANAAPHIEREIAHAFYTRRTIITFRSTDALPRREFLFYLGDARWFDALCPPADQHLEALTARVQGLLLGPAVTSSALPTDGAKKKATLNSLNSWKGERGPSRYGNQKGLKRVAIAASVAALAWLLWIASGQTKHGVSPEESNLQSMNSGAANSRDLPAQAKGDASASTSHYSFTRLGLWVAANASPTPLIQQGRQDTPSTVSASPTESAAPSLRSDNDPKADSEPNSLTNSADVAVKPATPRVDRRAGLRGKSRKRRFARYWASDSLSFARIRRWVIEHLP